MKQMIVSIRWPVLVLAGVMVLTGCTLSNPPGIPNDSASQLFYQAPVLRWWALPDTQNYRFQLATDSHFNRLLIDETVEKQTQYALPDSLEPDQSYYWRVSADRGGLSHATWSKTRSFEIGLRTPTPISQPIEGPQPDFDFAWEPVEPAERYQWVAAHPGRPEVPLIDRVVRQPSLHLDHGLHRAIPYVWRVRAIQGRRVSAWSSPQPFSVRRLKMNPTVIESRTLRPVVRWTAKEHAINVQVELYTDPTQQPVVRDVARADAQQYRPDYNLLPGHTYTLKLRLIFAGGPGAWGDPIALTIPTIESPDGATPLLDTDRTHETKPTLSADGLRLVVTAYRKSSESLQLQRATEEAAAVKNKVVLVAKEPGRAVVDATELTPVAEHEGETLDRPTVSADGLQRVFAELRDGNWDIFVENVETTQVTQVTRSLADDTAPMIVQTAGGYTILFQSNRGTGGWGIYSITLPRKVQPEERHDDTRQPNGDGALDTE